MRDRRPPPCRPAPHRPVRPAGTAATALAHALALALLALLASPAARAQDAQPDGGVTGRVFDAETGLPVAGIRVVAMPYWADVTIAGAAVTDRAGRYRIRGLYSTFPHQVLVEHGTGGYLGQFYDRVPCWGELFFWERLTRFHCGGRVVEPTAVTPAPREVVRGVDFRLERPGSIAGTVTAAATGEPLAGTVVTLWDDPADPGGFRRSDTAVTGATGRYEFPLVPPGRYLLSTTAVAGVTDRVWPGVDCPYNACDPSAGETVAVTFGQRVSGIDFALPPLGAIAGRVTGAAGGAPIEGVAVSVFAGGEVRGAGATGADGSYTVTDLPPGEYLVFARAEGFLDLLYDGVPCGGEGFGCSSSPPPTPVPVTAAATTGGIDFALALGGSIEGRVLAGGEPLEGVGLWIFDAARDVVAVATTGPGGEYAATDLAAGSHFVLTRDAGDRGWTDEAYDGVACRRPFDCPGPWTPVEVAAGAATGGIDFDLQPPGRIEGRITAAATGEALPGVPVLFWDGALDLAGFAVGTTDSTGRFLSEPLPRGRYFVSTEGHFGNAAYADQVYSGVQCPLGVGFTCAADEGTPVEVRAGEVTPGIDLALESSNELVCEPSASGACLGGGRYRVSVRWSSDRASGMARPLPLTGEATAFSFFAPDNPEVAVRVIDACPAFGDVWVFAAGLTDLGAWVTVFDGRTGRAWNAFNDLGTPFEPVFDLDAFSCLIGDPAAAASAEVSAAAAPAPQSGGPCVPGPTRLCLHGGRFAVEAEWTPPGGTAGAARQVPLGERSGWFWFTRPGAPELVVKVLDACGGPRPGWWVFAGGLTNLEVTLRVTDLVAGESREYVNPAGRRFEPVQDKQAFGCP